METFLIALGVPAPLTSFILNLPVEATTVIVCLFILIKFALIPLGNKLILQLTNKSNDLIKKLDEISTKLDNNNTRLTKIETMIIDLNSDSIGNTDFTLALSTFGLILDKLHLKALMHYQHRCAVNHYLNNESIIQSRYNNVSSELANKTFAQLLKYNYNGIPLSNFYKNGGIESYVRHLNSELYDLQGLKALKDINALEITDSDVEDGIDRLLQTQLNLFKDWINSQKDEVIYVNRKNEFPVKIIDNQRLG